jgi:hypothetical protein
VLPLRIELRTSPLPMECSTTELRQHLSVEHDVVREPAPTLRNHARMAANIRSLGRCRAIRWRLDEGPGAPYR